MFDIIALLIVLALAVPTYTAIGQRLHRDGQIRAAHRYAIDSHRIRERGQARTLFAYLFPQCNCRACTHSKKELSQWRTLTR